jgi:hypothetical protein
MVDTLFSLCLKEIKKFPEPVPSYVEIHEKEFDAGSLCEFIVECTNENIIVDGEIPTELLFMKYRFESSQNYSSCMPINYAYHQNITSHKPDCNCHSGSSDCFTWKPNAITVRDESDEHCRRFRFDDLNYLDFWMEISIDRNINLQKLDIEKIQPNVRNNHGIQVFGRIPRASWCEIVHDKLSNVLRIDIYYLRQLEMRYNKFYVEFLNFK